MIHRQAADRRLELIAVQDRVESVGRHRLVSRQDPHVRRPRTSPTPFRVASADGRYDQASKRAGSRSCGRSRQIATSARWPSSARSISRRILRDTGRNLAARSAASCPKASVAVLGPLHELGIHAPHPHRWRRFRPPPSYGMGLRRVTGLQSLMSPMPEAARPRRRSAWRRYGRRPARASAWRPRGSIESRPAGRPDRRGFRCRGLPASRRARRA